MTTTTITTLRGAIPPDIFRVRIAIVRTIMGWNYDEAELHTNINSETWRLWEKGERRCSDIEGAAAKIADATPFDRRWIQAGGPLAEVDPDDPNARKLPHLDSNQKPAG